MGDASRNKVIDGLFRSVRFFETGSIPEEVLDLLRKGGARQDADLNGLTTHCLVGDNPNYDYVEEAREILDIGVAHFRWVILSVKSKKLLPTNIVPVVECVFRGVVCSVSGLGRNDVKSVWAMLTFNGGSLIPRLDLQKVTHLICTKPFGVSSCLVPYFG
jgi:hypothetical protein